MRFVSLSYPPSGAKENKIKEKKRKEKKRKGDSCEEANERLKRVYGPQPVLLLFSVLWVINWVWLQLNYKALLEILFQYSGPELVLERPAQKGKTEA